MPTETRSTATTTARQPNASGDTASNRVKAGPLAASIDQNQSSFRATKPHNHFGAKTKIREPLARGTRAVNSPNEDPYPPPPSRRPVEETAALSTELRGPRGSVAPGRAHPIRLV